jgi:hypothetical protein
MPFSEKLGLLRDLDRARMTQSTLVSIAGLSAAGAASTLEGLLGVQDPSARANHPALVPLHAAMAGGNDVIAAFASLRPDQQDSVKDALVARINVLPRDQIAQIQQAAKTSQQAMAPGTDLHATRPADSSTLRTQLLMPLINDLRPTVAATNELLGSMSLDPRFVTAEKGNWDALANALTSDATVRDAFRQWNTPGFDRQGAVQAMMHAVSAVYGLNPVPTLQLIDLGAGDNGQYLKDTNTLQLNTHAGTGIDRDFKKVLNTVTHELTHTYQRALTTGAIPVAPAIADQVDAFKVNNRFYIPATDQYWLQPVEDHAMRAGRAVAREVSALLATVT